jgi:hypothetical protein
LIESLLEPSKKIKEGYHTNLITLKNGDSYAGGILSETDTEVVIRDLTGKHNRCREERHYQPDNFTRFSDAGWVDHSIAGG